MINRKQSPKNLNSFDEFHKKGIQILKRGDRIIKYLFILIFTLVLIIFGILSYFLIFTSNHHYLTEMTNEFIEYNNNNSLSKLEIIDIFNNEFSNVDIILNDNRYMTSHNKLIESFLKYDKTNEMKYLEDINDCDNFSFILFGNFLREQYQIRNHIQHPYIFGIAYGQKENLLHSFNFFINDNYDFLCIEPQEDIILPCNSFGYNIVLLIL
tara:strand:+ start:874 stop:1506 length:633 start_codon:yes stop_codon:yes gene_type:complete